MRAKILFMMVVVAAGFLVPVPGSSVVPHPPGGGGPAIEGTVQNLAGDPLGEATVTAGGTTATTDQNGFFILSVNPGTYTLVASYTCQAPDCGPTTNTYSAMIKSITVTTSQNPYVPVTITGPHSDNGTIYLSEIMPGQRFAMSPPFNFSGTSTLNITPGECTAIPTADPSIWKSVASLSCDDFLDGSTQFAWAWAGQQFQVRRGLGGKAKTLKDIKLFYNYHAILADGAGATSSAHIYADISNQGPSKDPDTGVVSNKGYEIKSWPCSVACGINDGPTDASVSLASYVGSFVLQPGNSYYVWDLIQVDALVVVAGSASAALTTLFSNNPPIGTVEFDFE
jgi:hypothetical protein